MDENNEHGLKKELKEKINDDERNFRK